MRDDEGIQDREEKEKGKKIKWMNEEERRESYQKRDIWRKEARSKEGMKRQNMKNIQETTESILYVKRVYNMDRSRIWDDEWTLVHDGSFLIYILPCISLFFSLTFLVSCSPFTGSAFKLMIVSGGRLLSLLLLVSAGEYDSSLSLSLYSFTHFDRRDCLWSCFCLTLLSFSHVWLPCTFQVRSSLLLWLFH